MGDFRWLIEAPGPRYLSVRSFKGGLERDFVWTTNHDDAIALRSQEQAEALMLAVRQMDRDHCGGLLFNFERVLSNAKPVEHGWISKSEIAR